MLIELLDRARDLEDVLEIETASFTNPWTREMFVWEIEHSDVTRIYVARDSDRVVAFCSAWLVLEELHINNLAVRPEWRGRGVATALLSHVLGEAAARGAARATLEVRRSNDAALRLYRRLGFRIAGTNNECREISGLFADVAGAETTTSAFPGATACANHCA